MSKGVDVVDDESDENKSTTTSITPSSNRSSPAFSTDSNVISSNSISVITPTASSSSSAASHEIHFFGIGSSLCEHCIHYSTRDSMPKFPEHSKVSAFFYGQGT